MVEKAKKEPIKIKKYANRRLYNTGSSSYVTLEDLGLMVRQGDDFVVLDAKSGEDITRTVLGQIIFEQENKGQNLLPSTFLRQLIKFYGDNMQSLVPNYLEFSLDRFMAEQQKLREQFTKSFGTNTFTPPPFGSNVINVMQEQVQANMVLFKEAIKAFSAFSPSSNTAAEKEQQKK